MAGAHEDRRCPVRRDGEILVQAAEELGYSFSITALEQAMAEEQELDLEELGAVAGGKTRTKNCEWDYVCDAIYGSSEEDEFGHSYWCITGWHCLIATCHTATEETTVKCWSDYKCAVWNH